MNTGAAAAGLTVTVIELVLSEPLPFVAVTTKDEDPGVVGVPDNTPPPDKLNPAGRPPVVTENVGAGYPDAANV